MKRSEKIITGIVTLGLLAALTVGGTMAYMTDKENKVNTFTVGTLDIGLEEKNWDPETDGEDVVPGDTYLKDPVIKALKNDSYVRAYIVVKDKSGNVITDSERLGLIMSMIKYDSTYKVADQTGGTVLVEGNSYSGNDVASLPTVNPEFTGVSTGAAGKYCYNYGKVLKEGESVVLFTNLIVPTEWSQVQLDKVGKISIEVTVEAIQTQNFANAEQAFSALDSEIAAGTAVSNYSYSG